MDVSMYTKANLTHKNATLIIDGKFVDGSVFNGSTFVAGTFTAGKFLPAKSDPMENVFKALHAPWTVDVAGREPEMSDDGFGLELAVYRLRRDEVR